VDRSPSGDPGIAKENPGGAADRGAVCASCFAVASVLQSYFLAGFVGLYFLTHEIRHEYLFSGPMATSPTKALDESGSSGSSAP